MSNHIILTVPSDNKKALVAGATMLLTLADKVPEMELDDAVETVVMPGGVTIKDYHDGNNGVIGPDKIEGGTTPPPEEKISTTLEDGGTGVPPRPTTPPPADVQLDKNNLPWDPRIHAGTKALLADGAWRYKQGVDRAVLVPQVEEELRTLMATTTTATPPPETAATTTPPPVDTDAPTTFPEFLKAVSGLISTGTTTMVEVNAVLNQPQFGIASIQLVNSRPDLIPNIWAELVAVSE